ncbi:hypothetical protein [Paenibacillus sp. DMB5]|uniref:hypothetical protein n=1 Tax=Paenibacillus sp. DMB5 TaxID=1780103 RepID=UPI000AC0506E|nr:hypothetical protein [Paenibacillus sp. DMB5]
MKILYYGSACDEEWFVEASKIKKMPSYVAQYKFEMALLNGFSEIDDIDMETHYLYQENYYPTGHFLKFKSKIKKINQRYKVKYISYINLPLLKEIDFFLKGLLITLKWAVKNRKNKEKIIFTPFNYTPLSLGVWLAAKLARIKRANVFTDLSSDIINKERQANMIF